jgi:hypothetical protein
MKQLPKAALSAWVMLAAGCAIGLAAWVGATDTTVRMRESFGHGRLPYREIDRTTDPGHAAIAVGAPLAGAGSWAVLRARTSRHSKLKFAAITVAVVAAAAAGTYATVEQTQRPNFDRHEYYAGAEEVAAEMAQRDIGCRRTREATVESSAFAIALDCRIPAELAIDDGFDDASIRMWASEEARDRWLERTDPWQVNAAVGPTWIVVCEFESTCSEIQSKIGGLNH